MTFYLKPSLKRRCRSALRYLRNEHDARYTKGSPEPALVRLTRPRIATVLYSLEVELKSKLHQARRHGADNLTEGRIINIAVNGICAEELGVVKRVERFPAEF